MTSILVGKSILHGETSSHPSKSYTHRDIIIPALAKGKSTVINPLKSRDTEASILAAQALGAFVERKGNTLEITGNGEGKIQDSLFYAGNSGTTLRIMTAIAALNNQMTELYGDKSLNKRPMDHLAGALDAVGVFTELKETKRWVGKKYVIDGTAPVFVKGPIREREIVINGSQSSQYVSALLVAAPLAKNGMDIQIKGGAVSTPYMDITVAVMKKFGIKFDVEIPHVRYSIQRQEYTPTTVTVPTDYSGMAFPIAAGIMSGVGVTINAVEDDLPQGDKAILDIVERLGAKIKTGNGKIEVSPSSELEGGAFDLANTPDLVIPVGILGMITRRPLTIENVAHARRKETDRIDALTRELKKVGLRVDQFRDGLTIERYNGVHGAVLESYGDHRMFMGMTVVGMYTGNAQVNGLESVNVSFPGFISEMQKLGGEIKILLKR
ncbi:MAG: 3-phosphoshikimate 1-carboxyvinyltransferase [Candidatus Micrarchaeota archaeon]|nr:3-phosphoshikimate 1-carboxyvinyltransferase [Candidatus Micrarchaeota archaeon]